MTLRIVLPACFLCVVSGFAQSFGPGFSTYQLQFPIYCEYCSRPPLVPLSYGALTVNPGNTSQLILGGAVGSSGAAFYSLNLLRDTSSGRILGFGPGYTLFANAAKLDSGATFGQSGVFVYSIESGSSGADIGMVAPGSRVTNRVVQLVQDTPGAVQFVPAGLPGAGRLKLLTNSGKFYDVPFRPDGALYTLLPPTLKATLPPQPVASVEGFVYVAAGSPGFPLAGMLVAEQTAGVIAAYEIDASGDPRPSTRRVFYAGAPLQRPQGLAIDPVTGDLLITTRNNSSSGLGRISGFQRPPPEPPETQVTACREITAPGRYVVVRDLTAGTGSCLKVHDTHEVTIRCYGAKIAGTPAIEISGVTGFVVSGCAIESPFTFDDLLVTNSSFGVIEANSIGNLTSQVPHTLSFWSVSDTVLRGNTLHTALQMHRSSRNTIELNNAVCPVWTEERICPGIMLSDRGRDNVFDRNVLDGRATPAKTTVGGQVGIGLQDEDNDIVRNNTIRDISAVAIVTSGTMRNLTIRNNSISNSLVVLGAWHWNNWIGNTVSENVAVDSGALFMFRRLWGLRPANWGGGGEPADTGFDFRDNTFTANRVINSKYYSTSAFFQLYTDLEYVPSVVSSLPGERPALPSEIHLSNNKFTANDFGYIKSAPEFGSPVTGGRVIDGGNNKCTPPMVTPYPLVCH